jgi:hypothetical protein
MRSLTAAFVLASLVLLVPGVVTGDDGRKPERVVGLKYKEPKDTEFLKAVLTSMNVQYTVTDTPDGELVEWASTDPAQELEIQNRVSQFWFISTQCPGMPPPAPSQPARARLSC